MTIYLYHKRHKITGINYFGKTQQDPYLYDGSGIYWLKHLIKHGSHVETITVWEFNNVDECSSFALDFSNKYNIVKSAEWANLCPEDGLMGGNKFIHMSENRLEEIKKLRIETATKNWENRDKNEFSKTIANVWANRSDEKMKIISENIRNGMIKRTPEEKLETLNRRQKTLKDSVILTCIHCDYKSNSKCNMTRYHFDNCKKKL
jgi:hypothetical protein